MIKLNNFKIAVIATDGFEESELIEPVKALREVGGTVHVLSPNGGKIQGFKHHDKTIQIDSDRSLSDVRPSEYDAVVLPGGALNADALRTDLLAQEFVSEMDNAGKAIAVICHGAWLLVSAGLVEDRLLTSWPSIADDIRNAGGEWQDSEVVVDENWVSSRKPDDLPAFIREMLKLFSRSSAARRSVA